MVRPFWRLFNYQQGQHDSLNPSNAKATFAQSTRTQRFLKTSEPCHVGIYWIALAEHPQMSTHLPVFRLIFHYFFCIVLVKLSTSSMRVKHFAPMAHVFHRCKFGIWNTVYFHFFFYIKAQAVTSQLKVVEKTLSLTTS